MIVLVGKVGQQRFANEVLSWNPEVDIGEGISCPNSLEVPNKKYVCLKEQSHRT
jgi:hypothetical protein